MIHILRFILMLIVIIFLSILINRNYKIIPIYFVVRLLIIEILVAYFFINSQVCLGIIYKFSLLFHKMLFFSSKGIDFVFGNMNKQNLAFFFLNVLCPIVFISSIIGILQYIRIMPYIINIIGTFLSKINGMGKLESFNAISSLMLGQPENFIIYKDIFDKIPTKRMYTLVTTTISTVSIFSISAYINLIKPVYIMLAIILNMFSTFIIMSLINPYQVSKEDDLQVNYAYKKQNFFELLEEYILTGFKIAITISAMLMGFISLIYALNSLFNLIFGISFQNFIGYIFIPFAWMLEVPACEILKVSSIMATKIISNEFIAMIDLQKISNKLSYHSVGILSVFLISFSNFSSIGIILGSLKELNIYQKKLISRYVFKIMYGSILISLLSSAVTSLVI